MFKMELLWQIPFGYIISTIFQNNKGFIYGLKEIFAFFYVSILKLKQKSRFDFYDFGERENIDLEKLAIKIPPEEYNFEHRRPLLKHQSESVLFYGGNSEGAKLIVRISRIPEGLSSLWLILKLATGEEYSLPSEQFFVEPKTGKESFYGGGLRLKCLVPMRRWRITFNGFLKKTGKDKDETVHVKFGFLWIASSSPQNISSDIHVKTWAKYLSEESDWDDKISTVSSLIERYVQSGNLLGVVQIPIEGIEDREMFLWGARRKTQDIGTFDQLEKSKEYICYFESGDFLHFGQIQLPSSKTTLDYAFILFSNALGGNTKQAKISDDGKGNKVITFTRGPFTRHCLVKINDKSISLNNGDTFSTVANVSFIDAVLEDDPGHGIMIVNERKIGQQLKKPKIRLPPLVQPNNQKLVLQLTNEQSRLSEITGGKGSSLAQLTILSKEDHGLKFQVPKAIVVTTNAYEKHIMETDMKNIIEPLENIAREKPDLLQESCKLAVSGFQNRPMSQIIKDKIKLNLEDTFGNDFLSKKFAVRSSASGEDSEELSAAGQMTTYLGIQGLEKIYDAVIKCWSSQFSFIAIQYKRQNGQLLNSPMAVVIQEMIPAEVAGVMFTCDPVTGNPAKITITANYGIGESVVSAAAEPDTIIIGRNQNGLNSTSSIDIGKKSVQIVLSGDGVKEESLSEDLSSKASLSIEEAKFLAKVGILVEQAYGMAVDIEFGFFQKNLYLLQARPITTFEKESDLEIVHENDTPLRSELEYTSTANVGEVMPGAFSHLGVNSMNSLFQTIFQWRYGPRSKSNFPINPYFLRSMTKIQNHSLFNLFDSLLRFYHGEKDLVTHSQMISMFGRILDDEDMLKRATKRNEFYPPNSVLMQTYYILTDMIFGNRRLNNDRKKFWDSQINISKYGNAAELHHQIWKQFLQIGKGVGVHVDCTMVSSFYNMFLLSILEAGNKGFGLKVFQDFAYILSSCYEVESVDVPNAIEKLAETISRCTSAVSFKEMKTEDALDWLNSTGTEAGRAFKRFLKMHGHRCYKEFDIRSKPWGFDPMPLVKTLQGMANVTEKKESKKGPVSIRETIRNLSVSLNWKQKLLACIAIPLCRKAVGMRERSKSLTIKIMDKLRMAYRHMGELMVMEGRLPDSDLMFFFTCEELDDLIKTRSPFLIQKAIRRRALYPTMDNIKFPEISRGYPIPINYSQRVATTGSLVMKGTPVSTGVVEGVARVATSVEEASNIQNGEILIAYSTDIGWSPFFPMLAGVATELGGLVSHGAVVAREYGLPCVVGVHGATIQFKTGDRVLLNGNKGTLERLD